MIRQLKIWWTEKSRLRAYIKETNRMNEWLTRELNSARSHESENKKIIEELRAKLKSVNAVRPARLKLDGAMPPDQIERTLRGTKDSPIVKAIEAHVCAKMVEASDAAMDRPSVLVVTHERVIMPYTAEDRLHDAGRGSSLAELLVFLQEATKSEDQSAEKKNAA